MTPPALLEAHRRELQHVTGLAERNLTALWREFDSAAAARDVLADVLPALVAAYGSAAATLAADWYDDLREAEDAPGRFRAIPAPLPDAGRTESLAGWAVAPLAGLEPDRAAALTRASGGLQRIIANASRDTVIGSAAADPAARGWSRSTTGRGCDFCRMIAGRGAVYSADTADFSSHDHCHCIAVPAYGESRGVKAYTPSQRFRSEEERARHNARLRESLRSGRYDT